jgi:hypothetical protein
MDPLRLAGSKPWTLHLHHALQTSEIHFYNCKSTFCELQMLVYPWSKFTALADLRHDSRLSCSRLHTLEITTPQTNQNSRASRQSNGYFRSFEPRVGRTLTSPTQSSIFEPLDLENTQRSANDGGFDSDLDNLSIISSSSEDGHARKASIRRDRTILNSIIIKHV